VSKHYWKSLWDCIRGAYICQTCGLLPKDCKGRITVEVDGS